MNNDSISIAAPDKTIRWYKSGRFHRTNGPAFESPCGDKEWYIDGQLHREDGPAVEYITGYCEWWIHGVQYTKEEFYFYLEQKKPHHDLQYDLSYKEQKTQFKI